MNPLVKLLSTAASMGGAALANKALSGLWTKTTGKNPPSNNLDEDRWRDILLWAALSSLLATVIQVSINQAQRKLER